MTKGRILAGGGAVLLAAGLGSQVQCPTPPGPGPSPTPTVEPSPGPTVPAPVCQEGEPCGCWALPPGEGWQYVCCAPWLPGGVLAVADPGQCPVKPSPEPTPTTAPTPTPGLAGACPKPLKEGARVYMANKAYGQGLDSTVRVYGDPAFCYAIHGEMINDCHLEGWMGPSGDDPTARSRCEMQLLDGCPVWQFTASDPSAGAVTALRCSDNKFAAMSCDHFGDPAWRDDPQTPTTGDTLETLQGFEGKPLACGLQRDMFGPFAGFFVIAHGRGWVRACRPDWQECGPWRFVNK